MLKHPQHQRYAALIVAFLMTLSCSGFTTVLHSCLMKNRGCCETSMGLMHRMTGGEPASPGNLILKSNMSCCATTVAGGLNTNPIVSGTQHSIPQHLSLLALLPADELSCAQSFSTSQILSSCPLAASPPSVEKYVLNAAFLI